MIRAKSSFGALAVFLGLAASALSLALTWRRSIGNDEGATLTSALRPWSAWWDEVLHLDAVHAAYYALMHLWFQLVPANVFTLRLPSAIFVGVAVVLLAFIGRRLFSPSTGLIAAAVLALMPRVTYVGGDARSLALALALSLAGFVAVFWASERGGWARWAGYALLVMGASWVNFYTLLVLPAHFLLLRGWQERLKALAWAALGAALSGPVILVAARQSGQLGWLQTTGWHSLREVFVEQFADTSLAAAVVLWVGAVAGGIVVVVRHRRLVPGMLWWVAGPTALLLTISLFQPLYHPRYVTASAPAVALLVAVAIGALRRRWMAVVALLLVASFCVPGWAARRGHAGLDGTRWDLVAEQVREVRDDQVPDVVAYGPMPKKTYRSHRRVGLSYPEVFAGATDLTLGAPKAQNDYLWGADEPPLLHLDRLGDRRRVLVLVAETERAAWAAPLEQELRARGFALSAQREVRGSLVLVYDRPA